MCVNEYVSVCVCVCVWCVCVCVCVFARACVRVSLFTIQNPNRIIKRNWMNVSTV